MLGWAQLPKVVTGCMATREVAYVSEDVEGFSVGDKVFYRGNRGLQLRRTNTDFNCRIGSHFSVAVFDPTADYGAALAPERAAGRNQSVRNAGVGLYGADLAGVSVGANVVVIGLGLIGLGVVSAASRRRPLSLEFTPREECRAIATQFGALETLSVADARTTDAIVGEP